MLVQILPNFRKTDSVYRILFLCVVTALVLVATSLRRPETRQLNSIVISLILVLLAFGVDRLFTGRVAVIAYQMNWSANGTAPWGDVERNEKVEVPFVVYRKVEGGYCFDAVFSPELNARLAGSDKAVINVEYNVFSDFGRRRGYNLRSVDGLIFNQGDRPVRSGEGFSGYIEGSVRVDCGR